MEEALLARLRANTTLQGLLGTTNSRASIDWIERSPNLPAISLQDITAGSIYAHDGRVGLANPNVQVDCWAQTYGEAKQVARAVQNELEAAETIGGIAFSEGFLTVSRAIEPEDLGSGIKVFRQSLEFSLWFEPA